MFVVHVAVSVVLVALLLYSASQKLRRSAEVVESYRNVGVPPNRLAVLAALLVAGGLGVLAGLAWAPIGIAAAAGLVVYFLLAVGAHVRHDQLGNVATPVVLTVLAAASLVLRSVTM
jgi:hypothetical protein